MADLSKLQCRWFFHYASGTEGEIYRWSPRTQCISKLTGHGTSKMTNTVMMTPLSNRMTASRILTTMLHFCLVCRFSSVSKRRARSRRGRKENLRQGRDRPLTVSWLTWLIGVQPDSEAEAEFPVQTQSQEWGGDDGFCSHLLCSFFSMSHLPWNLGFSMI